MACSIEMLKQTLSEDLSAVNPNDELAYFRAEVLKDTLLKKYVPEGGNSALHTEALYDFIERNEMMSPLFLVPEHRLGLLSSWSAKLHDVLCSGDLGMDRITLDTCFNYGIAGPGSSVGTKHTNLLDKMFNSDLTTDWMPLYSHYAGSLPARWAAAEAIRAANHEVRQVDGSGLTSVPKDSKKNRTICTEPSLNMFYQLGAKHIINDLLVKFYHLDVRTQQDINKNLARLGSIDGSNATLDLKNASDSIHVGLVAALLPPLTFSTLMKIRSSCFTVTNPDQFSCEQLAEIKRMLSVRAGTVFGDKLLVEFNMISSMGNGFTFSLMTLLLTTLLDVFLQTKGSRYTPQRDGVYGDDIILPSAFANEFTEVLSDFGFIVNLDKSFITGPFRESCGGDYFRGHNVRGVYLKELRSETDLYSAFNRLYRWSCSSGIMLPRTLCYIKGLVNFRPIPQHEADDGGIKLPEAIARSYISKRDGNGALRYTVMVPKERYRKIGDYERNFHAALIAAVGGYVRGQRITVRINGQTKYRARNRVTPNWDSVTPADYLTYEAPIDVKIGVSRTGARQVLVRRSYRTRPACQAQIITDLEVAYILWQEICLLLDSIS